VTYLMLVDREAGDAYMRVADGSVSPLFQNLRRPDVRISATAAHGGARKAAPVLWRTAQKDHRTIN
jgi:hypothetical protein